jgi:hypothetical protein
MIHFSDDIFKNKGFRVAVGLLAIAFFGVAIYDRMLNIRKNKLEITKLQDEN